MTDKPLALHLSSLLDEDTVNYKKCSMFLGAVSCSFKCCSEAKLPKTVCQNSSLYKSEVIEIPISSVIKRYLGNPLTSAVVWGGLEPFDQYIELREFITEFRKFSKDDIVIYTGYEPDEISFELSVLKEIPNIIIKFGRYLPNQPKHYDKVLGVDLASLNQRGVKIS